MSYHVVIPVLVSFALSLVLGPIVIPFLRKLKMGQTEREEGVQSHLKKAGTPTMGGIIILASVVITSLFYVKDYPKVIPILFLTLGFGLIGFLDDYLKVVMKRSDGLYPKQKMALQLVVTAIFAYYVFKVADIPMSMLIPFSGGKYWDIGWLAVPLLFIAVIGTVNGTNFTDGLDGLASSVTVLVATFCKVLNVGTHKWENISVVCNCGKYQFTVTESLFHCFCHVISCKVKYSYFRASFFFQFLEQEVCHLIVNNTFTNNCSFF